MYLLKGVYLPETQMTRVCMHVLMVVSRHHAPTLTRVNFQEMKELTCGGVIMMSTFKSPCNLW